MIPERKALRTISVIVAIVTILGMMVLLLIPLLA